MVSTTGCSGSEDSPSLGRPYADGGIEGTARHPLAIKSDCVDLVLMTLQNV